MTDTVLRIDTSARRAGSVSRDLTDQIIARLAPATIITRDLTQPIPQIDEAWVSANSTPVDDRTDTQRGVLALSDELVAEIVAADTIVIGLPIYNFGVPAAFKAWIDQIARAGVTFRYTDKGPEGLLKGKRAVLAIASGGVPVGSEVDFASPFARQVLNFIGITDVSIVAADRLMVDAAASHKAANDQIAALAA